MPADIICVIPARLNSQRLPRKMLRMLNGKPLLEWTYEAATQCPQFSKVLIAVDSEEVARLCERNGWPYLMTSPDLSSGTDRLYAVSQLLPATIYVNIQGDEPLIEAAHIEALIDPFHEASIETTTLKVRCSPAEADDPNTVKVVTAKDGHALYFSRSAVPFYRSDAEEKIFFRHLGLYAYRRAALIRFAQLPLGVLEQAEKLEQLRLLENGLNLHVREVDKATIGVDTEADLRRVEQELMRRAGM